MHIAYWISEAPNTNSEYVIPIASPGNSDYAHALQHSVISTLPVLYLFSNEHRPPAGVLAVQFDFVFISFAYTKLYLKVCVLLCRSIKIPSTQPICSIISSYCCNTFRLTLIIFRLLIMTVTLFTGNDSETRGR